MDILSDQTEVEYIDAVPYPKVSPKRTHALVQRALLAILERCGGEAGEFAPEWRFGVGAADNTYTSLIPDISFISKQRLAQFSQPQAEEPPCAPDVAIEVRSPSSRPALIREKIARYFKAGCLLVLDVDPQRRTIAAHAQDGVRIFHEYERFEHDAVPWLQFDVAEAFAKLNRA